MYMRLVVRTPLGNVNGQWKEGTEEEYTEISENELWKEKLDYLTLTNEDGNHYIFQQDLIRRSMLVFERSDEDPR